MQGAIQVLWFTFTCLPYNPLVVVHADDDADADDDDDADESTCVIYDTAGSRSTSPSSRFDYITHGRRTAESPESRSPSSTHSRRSHQSSHGKLSHWWLVHTADTDRQDCLVLSPILFVHTTHNRRQELYELHITDMFIFNRKESQKKY